VEPRWGSWGVGRSIPRVRLRRPWAVMCDPFGVKSVSRFSGRPSSLNGVPPRGSPRAAPPGTIRFSLEPIRDIRIRDRSSWLDSST
jgi:hypothetical protein